MSLMEFRPICSLSGMLGDMGLFTMVLGGIVVPPPASIRTSLIIPRNCLTVILMVICMNSRNKKTPRFLRVPLLISVNVSVF